MSRRKVSKLRREIGVVFQDFRLLKDRNVYENVAFAQRAISVAPKYIRKNVAEVLTLAGISEKYRQLPFWKRILRLLLLYLVSENIHSLSAIAAVYPVTWATAAVTFCVLFAITLKKSKNNNL